ncbi:hypothetical protein FZ025_01895 [Xanthomonas hyacinthi]|nr:hypothetical protein FZ025_01895 [Xanthomonas hyacinthi]
MATAACRIDTCATRHIIPSHPIREGQRHYDRARCKDRHLAENFVAKLTPDRAIATRYHTTACNVLGAIHWIASAILLNR